MPHPHISVIVSALRAEKKSRPEMCGESRQPSTGDTTKLLKAMRAPRAVLVYVPSAHFRDSLRASRGEKVSTGNVW
jgi:hypothetical protein